jgi:hypothetical protein
VIQPADLASIAGDGGFKPTQRPLLPLRVRLSDRERLGTRMRIAARSRRCRLAGDYGGEEIPLFRLNTHIVTT